MCQVRIILQQKNKKLIKGFLFFILNYLNFLIFFQTTNNGEAINIEEYVPAMMPIIKAKTKNLIDSPPNKYKARRTSMVVNEVFSDLTNVWLTLSLTVSLKDCV